MTTRVRGLLTVGLLLGCLVGASSARAQGYPPQPVGCDFDVQGRIGDESVDGRAEYQGVITVHGGADCAGAFGEVKIRVSVVPLGSLRANEDGSFRESFTLPASVRPGSHPVTAQIEDRSDVEHPLEVIGATVLGTSISRDDGGVLPRTGAGILLFVLWALALVTLGSILVAATWRVRYRFVAVGARRSPRTAAASIVPFVDTSGFVPHRTRIDRTAFGASSSGETTDGGVPGRETLDEWDARRRSEIPS